MLDSDIFLYSQIKKGLCVANITAIRILISGSALNEIVDRVLCFNELNVLSWLRELGNLGDN